MLIYVSPIWNWKCSKSTFSRRLKYAEKTYCSCYECICQNRICRICLTNTENIFVQIWMLKKCSQITQWSKPRIDSQNDNNRKWPIFVWQAADVSVKFTVYEETFSFLFSSLKHYHRCHLCVTFLSLKLRFKNTEFHSHVRFWQRMTWPATCPRTE